MGVAVAILNPGLDILNPGGAGGLYSCQLVIPLVSYIAVPGTCKVIVSDVSLVIVL